MTQPSQTLCLIKPDAVRRGLIGEVLARIERAGLRIAALKIVQATQEQAEQHYTWEDIGARHGEGVWKSLHTFLLSGPVVAFVVEGISAVENMRRLCGATEPSKSAPGTIRGDFSHHDFAYARTTDRAIRNIIHASATDPEAQREIAVWFSPQEIVAYRRSDAAEHLLDQ